MEKKIKLEKLKDFNYLIFSKSSFINFVNKLLEINQSLSIQFFGGLFIGLTTWLVTKTPDFQNTEYLQVCAMGIVAFMYLACNFQNWKTIKPSELIDDIEGNCLFEKTAILVIKTNIEGKPHLLVSKSPSWNCFFLPHYSVPLEETPNSITPELEKKEILAGGKAIYLKDKDLKNQIIWHCKDQMYKSIHFYFYCVSISLDEESYLREIIKKKYENYTWKTLRDLSNDVETSANNGHIIKHLEYQNIFANIPNAFDRINGILPKERLKVIWNINNKCSFKCTCCATVKPNKEEGELDLNFEDKLKIIRELEKLPNMLLDISGGNPLDDEGKLSTLDIVEIASRYLGKEKISLTITGKSIDNISTIEHQSDRYKKLKDLASTYEFTLDCPETIKEQHREKSYYKSNYKHAKELQNLGCKIHILIPLMPNLLSDDNIDVLVNDLKRLSPEKITLLRYMPVGRAIDEYQEKCKKDYDPMSFVEKIQAALSETNIQVKLQCALRVLEKKEKKTCNFLLEKLGIDHLGNLYACAWAGYLKDFNNTNTFYLGNLIESSIEEIFKGTKYLALEKKAKENKGSFCKICSFFYDKKEQKDIFKNNDPLAKKGYFWS